MKIKIVLILLFFISGMMLRAQEYEQIVNLRGLWKFNIGDDTEWLKSDFNDFNWEKIKVPATWEDEGFNGYNGYAWYRKDFTIESKHKGKSLFLFLGGVDDADEVYINGRLIGKSGNFPPDYISAYYTNRRYPIPSGLLNYAGNNIIAVRVFDGHLEGGILGREVGIFALYEKFIPDINLQGEWQFCFGNDVNPKDGGKNVAWEKIYVPGFWEIQKNEDYDGFAWYRKTFNIGQDLINKNPVLVLGKIDDIDQTYINGKLIGSTGDFTDENNLNHSNEYLDLRGYFIQNGILHPDKENVILVKVYDGYKDGGIYEGPIGIVSKEKYSKFWTDYNKRANKKSFWDRLFGW